MCFSDSELYLVGTFFDTFSDVYSSFLYENPALPSARDLLIFLPNNIMKTLSYLLPIYNFMFKMIFEACKINKLYV